MSLLVSSTLRLDSLPGPSSDISYSLHTEGGIEEDMMRDDTGQDEVGKDKK